MIDLLSSAAALLLVAAGAVAYLLHVRRLGRSCFARVEANGASPLLGKPAQELGYYCLQPLAQAAIDAGLDPNQLTSLSLALGLGSGAAAALGHLGVAGALASAAALCDVLDGMVARATGAGSAAGALLDASVDRATEFLLLAGLALHLRGSASGLPLTLLAVFGSFMVSYGSAKAEAMRVPVPGGAMRRVERATWLCAGLLLTPFATLAASRGLVPAQAAEAPLFACLALVAVVSTISSVFRLATIARRSREQLSAAPPRARVLPLQKRQQNRQLQ